MLKKTLKKIISPVLVLKIRHWQGRVTYHLFRLVARSEFLSSIYYIFFSGAFRREHRGVVYGRLKYTEELTNLQKTSYLLRRNIHMLEKGLLMRPRRDIFALDYIEATVNCYEQSLLAGEAGMDAQEMQWAFDVLTEYFGIVGSHPLLDKLKDKFNNLPKWAGDYQACVPYKRDFSQRPTLSYEAFLALNQWRRSVRWYEQKPVPRELIDKAITAAVLAPSACNRQPFEFRIFDDPTLVQEVASIPQGTRGFNQNFPVIIVVLGKLRSYFNERDRHLIYIDGALASMSFMLALETLGLSSCPINWPDVKQWEKKMTAKLGLEPDERPIMLISVGYPDPEGMVAYSQKKSLDVIRSYNQHGFSNQK
jgi:nitroreductase